MNETENMDELLRQVDELIGDAQPRDNDAPVIRNYANGYGQGIRGAASAPPRQTTVNPQPANQNPVRTAAPGGIVISNPDFDSLTGKKSAPKPEKPKKERPIKVPENTQTEAPKQGHFFRNFFIFLLFLVGAAVALAMVLMEQPISDSPIGSRKSGASTVLLCGTDAEGYRTDTMMLLYINAAKNELNLVSLPRDTLTYTTAGNYAKLNSAFGRNNGAEDPEEGMDALMDYVKDIVGFRPDGYMLVDLDCFVEAVDLMGGVEFDVPQDMYYSDPTQNLLIDLKAGKQKLNGTDAMGLVRFRKGYSNQDLGRVEVQRQFIVACLKQWVSPVNLPKLPLLLGKVRSASTTDLSVGNLLWLGFNGWRAGFGNMESATLPGYPDMVEGASVYVLYKGDTAELINKTCNPYLVTITREDLHIAS